VFHRSIAFPKLLENNDRIPEIDGEKDEESSEIDFVNNTEESESPPPSKKCRKCCTCSEEIRELKTIMLSVKNFLGKL